MNEIYVLIAQCFGETLFVQRKNSKQLIAKNKLFRKKTWVLNTKNVVNLHGMLQRKHIKKIYFKIFNFFWFKTITTTWLSQWFEGI